MTVQRFPNIYVHNRKPVERNEKFFLLLLFNFAQEKPKKCK